MAVGEDAFDVAAGDADDEAAVLSGTTADALELARRRVGVALLLFWIPHVLPSLSVPMRAR